MIGVGELLLPEVLVLLVATFEIEDCTDESGTFVVVVSAVDNSLEVVEGNSVELLDPSV